MRPRAWYPVQRVQNALPSHRAAQGVVAGACGLSIFFARPPVFSDRDDRSGAAREDGGVAATCIVGAVHCPAGHRDAMSREGTSRFSGPSARRKGICTGRVFCLRHSVEKSGTGQCSPANFSWFATIPEV
jgi:hypothetical protein